MSKTIRQIADDLGVSKQAVQQKIKKEPLASALRQFKTMNGNTIVIEEQGITLINVAFSTSENDKQTTTNDNDIVEFLKEQLREKDRQLAEKDKHISELIATNKAQAQSINADRHVELAGAIHQQLPVDDNEIQKSKRKFFNLFGKK